MSTFLFFLLHCWYFVIPLLLMFFAGSVLVFRRLRFNVHASTDLEEFLPVFAEKLEKDGVNGTLALCRARTDIIPNRLFVVGLEKHQQGLAAVRRAMNDVIAAEIMPDLKFLLPSILFVGKAASMTGQFVCIFSTVRAFHAAAQPRNEIATADAIGIVLFCMALAVVCGISLVFTHAFCMAWITEFEQKMQRAMRALMVLLVVDPS